VGTRTFKKKELRFFTDIMVCYKLDTFWEYDGNNFPNLGQIIGHPVRDVLFFLSVSAGEFQIIALTKNMIAFFNVSSLRNRSCLFFLLLKFIV
jgi:hypothetical protein